MRCWRFTESHRHVSFRETGHNYLAAMLLRCRASVGCPWPVGHAEACTTNRASTFSRQCSCVAAPRWDALGPWGTLKRARRTGPQLSRGNAPALPRLGVDALGLWGTLKRALQTGLCILCLYPPLHKYASFAKTNIISCKRLSIYLVQSWKFAI